ncbi:MAG: cupin domain-containing protein [Candidatus Latescibacterota bacterium]|nr:MAG: cupin domain-containing protein [Candidatus Latescibacterota bacterium]
MSIKHSEDVPKEPVKAGKGTQRQVLIGPDEAPNFALRRFIMDPGGGIPNHTNTVEHEQYVLRGRAKIGIGEEIVEVKTGDVVYIPARTPHWYEVQGEEPFEFLCVVPNLPDQVELLDKKE